MSQSKYNGINLDIGHYVAGTGQSPIPLIQKRHDRITSSHVKDRKTPLYGGQNVPWGLGDTPIKEVLQLMRKEKYKFPASIEYEYNTPEGSPPWHRSRSALRMPRQPWRDAAERAALKNPKRTYAAFHRSGSVDAASPGVFRRVVVSLDGNWQVADSVAVGDIPASLSHTVPVPGMGNPVCRAFPDADKYLTNEDIRDQDSLGLVLFACAASARISLWNNLWNK